MQYYTDELKKLNIRASECDINFLDSIEYFLEESNSHTTGIPKDVERQIKDQIRGFKYNCRCKPFEKALPL